MAGTGPWFRCVLFCLQLQILNSIKTKRNRSFYTKSLWCVAGIFTVTNNNLHQQEGVYIVWVQSGLVILTPEIYQFGWCGSGKYSNFVGLSLWLERG